MRCTIINADAITGLRTLEDNSIQTIVTSPPYYGLRNYGHAGQIGLEKTPEAYVERIVEVLHEARRVLRPDGTLWLNLGDTYTSSGRGGHNGIGPSKQDTNIGSLTVRGKPKQTFGLKPKELIGIPWRVAFALQRDGWFLRQDIIWNKPNPMPESVKDRCTKAHEYIFLLSKSERYYFDYKAIAEPLASASIRRLSQPNLANQAGSDRAIGKTNGRMKAVYTKPYEGQAVKDFAGAKVQNASDTKRRIVDKILSGELTHRNKRSVWTVHKQPYKGAHFATFPKALIVPCIKAGSTGGGENGQPCSTFSPVPARRARLRWSMGARLRLSSSTRITSRSSNSGRPTCN